MTSESRKLSIYDLRVWPPLVFSGREDGKESKEHLMNFNLILKPQIHKASRKL